MDNTEVQAEMDMYTSEPFRVGSTSEVLLEEVKPSSLAFTLGPTISVNLALGKAVFPAKATMHFSQLWLVCNAVYSIAEKLHLCNLKSCCTAKFGWSCCQWL